MEIGFWILIGATLITVVGANYEISKDVRALLFIIGPVGCVAGRWALQQSLVAPGDHSVLDTTASVLSVFMTDRAVSIMCAVAIVMSAFIATYGRPTKPKSVPVS